MKTYMRTLLEQSSLSREEVVNTWRMAFLEALDKWRQSEERQRREEEDHEQIKAFHEMLLKGNLSEKQVDGLTSILIGEFVEEEMREFLATDEGRQFGPVPGSAKAA